MALPGDPAPGTTAFFSGFSNPSLGSGGHVAFTATLSGSGVTTLNNHGVWAGPPETLALAARLGSQSADGYFYGGQFAPSTTFSHPVVNAIGQVAFRSLADGIYSGAPGSVKSLSRSNETAPGTFSSYYKVDAIRPPALSANGKSVFSSQLRNQTGGYDGSGVWAGTPGQVSLMGREGQFTSVGTYTDLLNSYPVINPAGDIAYWAKVGTGNAIFMGQPGLHQAVVKTFNNGGPFNQLGGPTINAAGQLAFTGATGAFPSVYVGSGTTWNAVAVAGQTAPGTTAKYGVQVSVTPIVQINRNGAVLFRDTLTGAGVNSSNAQAIFAGGVGAIELVARDNMDAPGIGGGVKIGTLEQAVINGNGLVAFSGTLTGTGVNSTNNSALWVKKPNAAPVLVARAGSSITSGTSTYQPGRITLSNDPSWWILGGGQDGRPTPFNDANQLAFSAGGIFLAQVPEPSGLLLAALGGVVLLSLIARGGRKAARPARATCDTVRT